MTGEHFIKALEEAVEQKKAICSIYDSALILTRESAEGIIETYKSQKAEIERLKEENKFHRKTITENAQRALEVTIEEIEKAKSEAIKEFAEKFKKKAGSIVASCQGYEIYETKQYQISAVNFDNLVKEMEGGTYE